MEYIESQFDVFKRYPDIDTYLDGMILSVDASYRGCGIANRLALAGLDFMQQNYIKTYHIVCSSHFAARVFEKVGFTVAFELQYLDYVDENGENPLLPAKPHVSAKVLVKSIQ